LPEAAVSAPIVLLNPDSACGKASSSSAVYHVASVTDGFGFEPDFPDAAGASGRRSRSGRGRSDTGVFGVCGIGDSTGGACAS